MKKMDHSGTTTSTGVEVPGFKAVGVLEKKELYYSKCSGDRWQEYRRGATYKVHGEVIMGKHGFHGCFNPNRCLDVYDWCTAEEDREYVVVPAMFSGVVKVNDGVVVADSVRITGTPVASYYCRPVDADVSSSTTLEQFFARCSSARTR